MVIQAWKFTLNVLSLPNSPKSEVCWSDKRAESNPSKSSTKNKQINKNLSELALGTRKRMEQ